MENRDRDNASQRDSSKDRQQSGTSAEFGKNIGRSENLSEDQGGMMRNKNNDNLGSSMENRESESGRRSGSGSFESQTGRTGSSSNVDRSSSSDLSRDSRDESSSRSGNGKPSSSDWNEGRH